MSGCPLADDFQWKEGWVSQDRDDHYTKKPKSPEFHLDGEVDYSKVKRSFCVKTDISDDKNRSAWPVGKSQFKWAQSTVRKKMSLTLSEDAIQIFSMFLLKTEVFTFHPVQTIKTFENGYSQKKNAARHVDLKHRHALRDRPTEPTDRPTDQTNIFYFTSLLATFTLF